MNENRTSSSRNHRDGREPSGFCCMKQKTQSLPHCRGVIGSKSMPQDSLSSFSTSTRHSSPPALTTSIVRSSSPDVRNLKSSASRTRRPLIVQTRSPISSSNSAASESGSTPMILIPFAIRSTSQEMFCHRSAGTMSGERLGLVTTPNTLVAGNTTRLRRKCLSAQTEISYGRTCDLHRASERSRHQGLRFHQLLLLPIAETFQPVIRPFPAQPAPCIHPKLRARP